MTCETIVAIARVIGKEYVYCIDSEGFMKVLVFAQPKDLTPVMAMNNPMPGFKGKVLVYAVVENIQYTSSKLSKTLKELAKLFGTNKVAKVVARHAENLRGLRTT